MTLSITNVPIWFNASLLPEVLAFQMLHSCTGGSPLFIMKRFLQMYRLVESSHFARVRLKGSQAQACEN